jgi:phytoene dehydrogenase-like protein
MKKRKMKMSNIIVELDLEQIEKIFANQLTEDYRRLKSDIRDLESRIETLRPHEEEDLEDSRKFADAVETLLKYYLPVTEAQIIIDEEYLKSEFSDLDDFDFPDMSDVVQDTRIKMLEDQVSFLMNKYIDKTKKDCKCE